MNSENHKKINISQYDIERNLLWKLISMKLFIFFLIQFLQTSRKHKYYWPFVFLFALIF